MMKLKRSEIAIAAVAVLLSVFFLTVVWNDSSQQKHLARYYQSQQSRRESEDSEITEPVDVTFVAAAVTPKTKGPDGVSSTGAIAPTTFSNVTLFGTVTWSNPGNASTTNGVYSTASYPVTDLSDYHVSQGIGSPLPGGAVIDGIEVTVVRGDTNGQVNDYEVKIVKNGSIVGTNLKKMPAWGTLSTITYGGPTELWGQSWTVSDIHDPDFGVAIACSSAGTDDANIDSVTINIYYHTASLIDAFRAIIEARKRIEANSMWTLRQSTSSQEIPLGMFVDEADGVTPLTALTIANTEIKLQPNGATSFTNKNSGGATHISGGHYYAVLDATDTATVGPMKIVVDKSGALPVMLYAQVLSSALYDWWFGSTAPSTLSGTPDVNVTEWAGAAVSTPDTAGVPEVNVIEWRGTTPSTMAAGAIRADLDSVKTQSVTCAAPITVLASVGTASTSTAQTGDGYAVVSSGTHGNAALKTLSDGIKTKTDQMTFTVTNRIDATATLSPAESDVISSGTATAGAATTITLQTALGANDLPNGALIKITSGTGAGQTRRVKDYVNGTKVLTVNRAWTVTPDNTSVYAVTYADQTPETHVVVGNCFTSTAGEEVRIAAWLERDGEMLALASGSASVTFREHGAGVDVFTETASAPTGQGIFEFTKTTASPGTPIFTSDRLQVASVSITDPEGNVYTSKHPSPIFG